MSTPLPRRSLGMPLGYFCRSIYPLTTMFEVEIPVQAWGFEAGSRMRFKPCDRWHCDNSYLTHEGELVAMQHTRGDEISVLRPDGSAHHMTKAEASALIMATRVR